MAEILPIRRQTLHNQSIELLDYRAVTLSIYTYLNFSDSKIKGYGPVFSQCELDLWARFPELCSETRKRRQSKFSVSPRLQSTCPCTPSQTAATGAIIVDLCSLSVLFSLFIVYFIINQVYVEKSNIFGGDDVMIVIIILIMIQPGEGDG